MIITFIVIYLTDNVPFLNRMANKWKTFREESRVASAAYNNPAMDGAYRSMMKRKLEAKKQKIQEEVDKL